MILQQVVNGIMLGSMYSLVGVAFALILGILGMLNIAIGEVFMVGAMVALSVAIVHLPWPLAILAAMALGGGVNLIIERFGFRPFSKVSVLIPILSSLAFSILLQNLAVNIWTSEKKIFPYAESVIRYDFGLFKINSAQIIIIATTVLLMVFLDIVIFRSKIGRAMRAIANNQEIANILGVDSKRVIQIAFFISGLLAGVAGVEAGFAYSQVDPFMGVQIGLKGLAATVVGGLGNIRGAVVGGLLVGITEVMSAAYISFSYRDMFVYGMILAVLLFWPQGVLGRKV